MKLEKRRQLLFYVSLIGIIIVTLIMGTTFAYQTIIVDYKDGSDKDISLEVSNLEVSFATTSDINLTNMPLLPDYKTADYSEFTIDNTKSTETVAYYISLENVVYSTQLVSEDFKYTIVKINDDKNEILDTGDFSTLGSTEFELNEVYYKIAAGKKETLRLYLWLKDNDNAQNYESSSFKGTLKITSLFLREVKNKTLADTIVLSAKDASYTNDAIRTIYDENFDSSNITGISGENERILALAEDDYGTSYFFRGNVIDNYVDFAGFTWRIVRINGDGSVRLILDGSLNTVCADYDKNEDGTCNSYAGTTSEFNTLYQNNSYIGYMYGLDLTDTENINQNRCLKLNETGNVTDYINEYFTKETCEANGGKWTTNSYEATHANVKDSDVKVAIDKFYEKYIENDTNDKHFEKYIADSIFCNDKSLSKSNIGYNNSVLGFGNNITYYFATQRLYFSIQGNLITNAKPSLKCVSEESNNFSRMTSTIVLDASISNIKNTIDINNDLKHPIALLTADELLLAGAFSRVPNKSMYLYDTKVSAWWTMTPYATLQNNSKVAYSNMFNFYGDVRSLSSEGVYNKNAVRPVINLSPKVIVTDGNGTGGDTGEPYVVSLVNET